VSLENETRRLWDRTGIPRRFWQWRARHWDRSVEQLSANLVWYRRIAACGKRERELLYGADGMVGRTAAELARARRRAAFCRQRACR
jgi:hypothetical protein